jgi:hypothetical protein
MSTFHCAPLRLSIKLEVVQLRNEPIRGEQLVLFKASFAVGIFTTKVPNHTLHLFIPRVYYSFQLLMRYRHRSIAWMKCISNYNSHATWTITLVKLLAMHSDLKYIKKKHFREQSLPYVLFHLLVLQKLSNLFKSTAFLKLLQKEVDI